MKFLLLKLIKFYQTHISAERGGFLAIFKPLGVCKYHPTCSEYSYQAIKKYGILKGIYLSIKRILKCNPFSKGGFDPLK